ncbi:MAG: hypothetical protein ABII80_04040 [bacterium]
MIGELLKRIQVDADFGRGRGEAGRVVGFQDNFNTLVEGMASAYQLDPDIYGQKAAELREEKNHTINDGNYFLEHLIVDKNKEQAAIQEYAGNHPKTSYGDGKRAVIGRLSVPVETIERLKPESSSTKTSEVVVTLAKRAAQLQALVSGEEGIPEAYALARGQAGKALELVRDAATLAYGWKSDSWGRLSIEGALERARKRLFGKRARTALLIGTLALAGCNDPDGPIGGGTQPEVTKTIATATATEVIAIPKGEASYIPDLSEYVSSPEGVEMQSFLNQAIDLAKTTPGMEGVKTPVIGLFTWKDGTGGESETMGFTLNPETQQTYLLYRSEQMAGVEVSKGHVEMKAPYYARATMGEQGQIASASYYYINSQGSEVEVFRSDGVNTEYVKADGERVGLDLKIIPWEEKQGVGRALSLIPNKTAEFYYSLPSGSVIDTEWGQITDAEGELIYIENSKGEWLKMVPIPQEVLDVLPGDYILDTDGMYMKDELAYGAKLMDSKKSVLYVLKAGEYVLAESKEFSENFPAAWSESYMGNVEGYNGTIPIIIGLSEEVITDPNYRIREVHLAQEWVDVEASAYLHAGYYRYREVEGNRDVSWEQFLNLVENGEAKVKLYELEENGVSIRIKEVDLREGFSILMTNKKMPVFINYVSGTFFGGDEKGRLFMATDSYKDIKEYFEDSSYRESGFLWEAVVYDWFADNIVRFSFVGNECLNSNNVYASCGNISAPSENVSWFELLEEIALSGFRESGKRYLTVVQ